MIVSILYIRFNIWSGFITTPQLLRVALKQETLSASILLAEGIASQRKRSNSTVSSQLSKLTVLHRIYVSSLNQAIHPNTVPLLDLYVLSLKKS